jgi:hypothetical protein
MTTAYKTDVIAWANEQASLLRAGKFSQLDIEHIADEVEDVGKSEQRELENRMATLLAHLIKWKFQPERRGRSWEATAREQRRMILRRLEKTPSLKNDLADPEWLADAWSDAKLKVLQEAGLEDLPLDCPWSVADVLRQDFLPD